MKFKGYILENPKGEYYKGHTSNLDARLERHNSGSVKSTRGKGPWKCVYTESFATKGEAMIREKQIKKWRRELLDKLISG